MRFGPLPLEESRTRETVNLREAVSLEVADSIHVEPRHCFIARVCVLQEKVRRDSRTRTGTR
jgi:hypothetical protein